MICFQWDNILYFPVGTVLLPVPSFLLLFLPLKVSFYLMPPNLDREGNQIWGFCSFLRYVNLWTCSGPFDSCEKNALIFESWIKMCISSFSLNNPHLKILPEINSPLITHLCRQTLKTAMLHLMGAVRKRGLGKNEVSPRVGSCLAPLTAKLA